MVHTDKIVSDLEFAYEGVFDFKEFLSYLKGFFKRYDYDLDEKVYNLKVKEGLKTTKIKWATEKKLDDYNKSKIKVKINLADYKESYVDGTKLADGNLKIEIEAEIEKDYEDQWKTAPPKKLMRGIYEKYIASAKQNKTNSLVKSTVDDLMKEIKQYFKT